MEQSFVAWAKVRQHRLPQVHLGIGDDAALMRTPDDNALSVVTTDSLMDGVHFNLKDQSPRRIGKKLVNVNLSDLAAMAAQPNAIFLSMCLPTNTEQATDYLASELYEGVCEAAEKYGVALAGGDTNCWEGPLVLHLTAIGYAAEKDAWLRSNAQPDDLIVVTGPLGGSIRGKHLDFEPRLDLVDALRQSDAVHAAMDISDGLSVDLLRMCDASRCGAIVHLDEIPISPAADEEAAASGKLAVEHAMGDGEDFELLLAVDPNKLDELVASAGENNVHVCGTFTSRTGLWAKDGGKIRQLTSSGYVHGR